MPSLDAFIELNNGEHLLTVRDHEDWQYAVFTKRRGRASRVPCTITF